MQTATTTDTPFKPIVVACIQAIGVASLMFATLSSHAQATIGVILSGTGPVASLGILEKNGVLLAADKSTSTNKFKYVHVDDASDPTQAARLTRKLIDEDHVDAIIGTTGTPGAFAMTQAGAEGKTLMISQAPGNALVMPVEGDKRWVFKTTTNDDHEGRPLFNHMKANKVQTLGFIGFADSYGDAWAKMSESMAGSAGITVVDEERYARTDTSVASQVLKLTSRAPDAVIIAGSGGAAATPVLELRKRGYKGKIYVTLGATFGDFLRITAGDAEGIYAPFAAVMGVAQVPDSNAGKPGAQAFVAAWEEKYGVGTANIFSAGGWDSVKLLEQAAPVAEKTAKPGTVEFRMALRDAMETIKGLSAARGVYNLSATDHAGLDPNALLVGQYLKGKWILQP
jgi:branched-chain amino acid transport system substrate-binding protein